LYLSTGDKTYREKIDLENTIFNLPVWSKVGTLSLYSIMTTPTKDKELVKVANQKLLKLADKYYDMYKNCPYKVAIEKFQWGSNGWVGNAGILLMHAHRLTGDAKYIKAADACLSYLFGANPTGYCFVTGYGKKSPMHIHERINESNGIEKPVPGYVAGGPTDDYLKDCSGKAEYPSAFPALSYLDHWCSYSTNEVTINWNAPAVFLTIGLDAVNASMK
jgi:endoglucanase